MTSQYRTPSQDICIEFRPIAPEDTIDLRRQVLWPNTPLDDQLARYDFAIGTIHLGAYISSKKPESGGPASSKSTATVDSAVSGLDKGYLPWNDPSADLGQDQIQDLNRQRPVAVLTLVPSPQISPAIIPYLPASTRDVLPSISEQVQLRKFAVHPLLQGQGVGTAFFRHVIDRIRPADASSSPDAEVKVGEGTAKKTFLTLDARSHQVGFYTRLGLIPLSEKFVKYDTGVSADGTEPATYVTMGMVI